MRQCSHVLCGEIRRWRTLLLASLLVLLAACAVPMPAPDAAVRAALAPAGKLRVGVYVGSPTSYVPGSEPRGVGYEVGRAISDNGGRIDNYMGDGLLALFGMDDPNGAARQAVRAGLGMIAAVEHLKPYVEKIYGRSFEIGIGIHYGEVVVGAIGAPDMKRVTVIGDAVNLAARIESATKRCGARLGSGQWREVSRGTLPGRRA